jgi:hypothetical protein
MGIPDPDRDTLDRMHRLLASSVFLALGAAATAGPATLADLLRDRGLQPPVGLADMDRPLAHHVVSQDAGETVIIYDAADPRAPASVVALRAGPARARFTRRPLVWPPPRPGDLDPETCRRIDRVRRHAGAILVTAHINPSAECTLILGRDLGLQAILSGWPVAMLPDGRIVYQRNQVHFAAFHPLGLNLFDPTRLTDIPLYPRKPYQPARRAHSARLRHVYTTAWCAAHNHPCDPDLFDEHLRSEVHIDARGDALAFVVAFDNTVGWTEIERWGRLEPFRELRAAFAAWDGQDPPPAALGRALAAGLAGARSTGASPHVAAALAAESEVRDLVDAALASPPPPKADAARWLSILDPRWDRAPIWRRLARVVAVPDEFTEVVYVYRGLRSPGALRVREIQRRDFEARFGRGSVGAALEPAALAELFSTPSR